VKKYADDEPVAIIGIGCRLPGGIINHHSLWQALEHEIDAIGPIPADRWDVERYYSPKPQQPGRMSSRSGGFLDEIDTFDAAFFGISGRIAEQMDPQQRLLLEVSWESLEDAGIVPADLAGGRTGVFVGACSQDYGSLQSAPSELEGLGPHSATGTFMSIVSNRLSYTFDLHGPSMTIDTACSSSLVAVHTAVQSLRRQESELALAGGVNVMLTPQFGIALSQAAMLSPDGRSRAFDSSANGYVRGEGAGIVVLKPLAAALLDGDRVYAVIRGTAINQDGRTQGITVPNGEAQESNFRAALAAAGIAPTEVGYVEAHGTGTPVGDPIEANALGRVLANGRRPGQTALLGSIKTNIGHLEAGAGIAGLIKAALCVYHRRIPPSLHFHNANPDIDFAGLPIAVATTSQPWPDQYARAVASVNSFGFGGTNANVVITEPAPHPTTQPAANPIQVASDARDDKILETLTADYTEFMAVATTSHIGSADDTVTEAADDSATRESKPEPEPSPTTVPTPPTVLTFSARTEHALDILTANYVELLHTRPPDVESLGAALALRRSHDEHRLVVVTSDAAEAVTKIRAGDLVKGHVSRTGSRKVAFLFNGQGPQWHAMGRTLLETSPVYRAKILECDRVAMQYLDWSIYEALTADEATSRVGETQCLQPTMFALQVALVELWDSWGVQPDAVLGHSMGEIAAAHVSGALSLSEALRVICNRARIQEKADASGGMMFVALPAPEAREFCTRVPDQLWVSAVNSPRSCTLSGRRPALQELATEFDDRGIFNRLLRVNCACHSPDMDPLRDELLDALAGMQGSDTTIPMYSTATGARIDGREMGTDYWWYNFRNPVLFEQAVRSLLADGYDTFVELSPHPVLANSLNEITTTAVVVSSLVRKKDDWASFLDGFARLYTSGCPIAWQKRYPAGAPVLDLPTTVWTRQQFWNESTISRRYRTIGQQHPMLKRVDGARPTWEINWDDHRLSWVRDHNVLGSVIVPGACYVEAALYAARELTGGPCALEFVEFERACVLSDEPQLSRLELDPEQGTFEFHQRTIRGDSWLRNARGRFHPATMRYSESYDLDAIRSRCTNTHKAVDIYGRLADNGYLYGPAFCGIDRLHVGAGEALARIRLPRILRNRVSGYLFQPAVLDACFQSAILHPSSDRPNELLPTSYLPTGIERARLYRDTGLPVWTYTRLRKHDDSLVVDIYLLDENGQLIAEFTPLIGKAVRQYAIDADRIDNHFYHLTWQPSGQVTQPECSAFTLGPADFTEELDQTGRMFAERLDRHVYANAYQHDVRRLCTAYVAASLDQLEPGAEFTVAESSGLAGLSGLLPKYHRAFRGMLRLLIEDGSLSEHAGRFRVERAINPSLIAQEAPANLENAEKLWSEVFSRYPDCAWELLLLRRTGGRLRDVLTGGVDPLELLFPSGSLADIEPIYHNSPIARLYNLLARRIVRRLADSADPRRTLRILEVGAGTGGLTASLLPVLPPQRCEYVFTDVSAAFLATARDRFRDYDFVDYRVLDLEHELPAEEFGCGSFDLVVAADVVHATADVKRSLLRLYDVLAPGGALLLLEAAPNTAWLDLTFGLTAGWWAGRDLRLRPDGPLLSAQAWQSLLGSVGFDDVAAFGDPDHSGAGSQTVLLAQTPYSAVRAEESESLASGASASDEQDKHEPEPLGNWWILTGTDPLGKDLAARIDQRGGRAVLAESLVDQDFAAVKPDGIIDLRNATGLPLDQAMTESSLQLLDLLKTVCRTDSEQWPRVYVLTRGAHAFRNDDVNVSGSPAWGLGPVARLELPQLNYTVIDLDPTPAPEELDAVWAELRSPDNEREIALRAGTRFVRRLVPVPQEPETLPAADLPSDTGFALSATAAGSLDELRYHTEKRRAPNAGHVEIEVMATGLNFLDVMTALGQVPPLESADGYRFGAECAGIVTRVGAGVADIDVGDAMVAVTATQGAAASYLTLPVTGVVAKPANLSFEAACSLPIVFLTAWYALHKLARLSPGERVLIHAAAGGTGMAAVQIARHLGAEVFATAGSPAKRELLRSLGVNHVFDSRSLDFADEIRLATDGAGVDVVLNSIAGESASRSIACLAPYGRFVELGKRDLLQDSRLGLRPFLRNLAYYSFDLRQLLVDRPADVHAELTTLMGRFAAGELHPLPYRVFHPSQTKAAFRHMAAARHIGKLVLAMTERELPVVRGPEPLSVQGTWLITGGLGGVGLAMAEHLVDTGVQHLVLVGRSGVSDEQTAAKVADLRLRGAHVDVDAADISSRAAVAALLDRIERKLPPLRGVLHCAMVLDDALIADLDQTRVTKVLAPKAFGAWHLHELTAHLQLEAFVLFSSATSMVGNRGQANYAIANAFLDHLAQARAARGQRVLTVNWGAVSDVGYVARHDDVGRVVAMTGMCSFSSAQAFDAMTTLLRAQLPQVGVLPMDWPQFFRHHSLEPNTQPRYEHISAPGVESVEAVDSGSPLRQQLRTQPPEARGELVTAALKARLAIVLGIPLDALDVDMPLMDYLDSLLAVEIGSWLERELGTKVTIMELMKGPSTVQLSAQVLARLDA
jgi:acyl transferase domain-containing protein/NADPH:quinone reductase-like Zn-dependent oxidoreductase/NAD(P)-dependent dehydrogenase (short-subunit alcohol dehydrogenase family)/SAM-dependent methyltransferase